MVFGSLKILENLQKFHGKLVGKCSFFMSFMTLFMDKKISDFEEGLKSLKEWCESSYSIIP